jgi:hypothetical protein
MEPGDYRVDFRTRQHHGNIPSPAGANDRVAQLVVGLQDVSVEEEQRVECLVLSAGDHATIHGEVRQEPACIIAVHLGSRLVLQKLLELPDPRGVGLEGLRRAISGSPDAGRGGDRPLAQGFEHGVLERLCYLSHGEKTKRIYHYERKEHKKEDMPWTPPRPGLQGPAGSPWRIPWRIPQDSRLTP